jgi:carboxyl-terminal processing protease
LKKIQLNPVVLVSGVLVLSLGSFYAGDIFHGQVALPGLADTKKADFTSLNDIYGLMQRHFDGKIDNQSALDGAKKGLVSAGGDPYTVYMTSTEAKTLNDDLAGKLSGIGAEIGIKGGVLTVIAPISGTPAEKAGLRAGDLIAKINNEDTTGMSVDTAVSKIRGKADTKVTLKIARSGSDPLDITITRADITVPSVTWEKKTDQVGYIKISQFGPDTAKLTHQAAGELKAQGAQKIILDLRNNGGGYLDAGVAVASEFVPQDKLVVEERTGGKSTNKLNSQSGGLLVGLPTIVLVNGGSASASEIVAGALHDNKAAQLLGEKTFGKGSVQEMLQLPGGAELKVTVAHWYTPGGININKEGIKPDVETKLTTDDYNASRDPQLDKALDLLK